VVRPTMAMAVEQAVEQSLPPPRDRRCGAVRCGAVGGGRRSFDRLGGVVDVVSAGLRAMAHPSPALPGIHSGAGKGGGAYPATLRWLIVYKRLVLGFTHREVTQALEGISKHCQADILNRFFLTGDVATFQGHRDAPPVNKVMSAKDDLWLLCSVIDDPSATLDQRAASFKLATGKTVHVSTLCRALRDRWGMSYQKVTPPARLARSVLLSCDTGCLAGSRPPALGRCSTGRCSVTSRRPRRSTPSS
jgi:transposase